MNKMVDTFAIGVIVLLYSTLHFKATPISIICALPVSHCSSHWLLGFAYSPPTARFLPTIHRIQH